ncbi:MAG: DUF302 domain-containing protein [Flavobacteriales bacterium]|nr:DUF302 domain-containing protein [Flavobacteriales bacterium]
MSYYFSKTIEGTFSSAIELITGALKDAGFGVITEIDMKATLKNKLDVDFKNYTILGACNPSLAYQALQKEDKVGLMLPCNVIVQEVAENQIEIAAVNPLASMQAIENTGLKNVAEEVTGKLSAIISSL